MPKGFTKCPGCDGRYGPCPLCKGSGQLSDSRFEKLSPEERWPGNAAFSPRATPRVRWTCLIVGIPIVASLPYLHGYFGMTNSFAFWAIAAPTALGATTLMLHEISRKAGYPTNPVIKKRLAVVLNVVPFPIGIGYVYFGLPEHAIVSLVMRLFATVLGIVLFIIFVLLFTEDVFSREPGTPSAIESVAILLGGGLPPLLVLLYDSVTIYKKLNAGSRTESAS